MAGRSLRLRNATGIPVLAHPAELQPRCLLVDRHCRVPVPGARVPGGFSLCFRLVVARRSAHYPAPGFERQIIAWALSGLRQNLAEREGLFGASCASPSASLRATRQIAPGDLVEPHCQARGFEFCAHHVRAVSHVPGCVKTWRRERDSNPRGALAPTPLAGERFRPLSHLSGVTLFVKATS